MNNTVVRTISGIIFVIIVLAGLLVSKYSFALLMIFIMISMMYEFYHMIHGKKYLWSRIMAIGCGVSMFVLFFLRASSGLEEKYFFLEMIPFTALMINSIYAYDTKDFKKISHIFAGLFYIALPISLSPLFVMDGSHFDTSMMICFLIMVWSSDVGAFIFGITLGKKYGKKLCPKISPKKSWMGFFGGMFMTVAASLIMNLSGFLNIPLYHCIIMSIIVHCAGVYGDLFESSWKRCCDFKDSGNLIPGHGGMLDRFDSSIFAIPAGITYLILCNLI